MTTAPALAAARCVLTPGLAAALRAHARAAHPEECCGFLLAPAAGGPPCAALPAVNRHALPGTRFTIAPPDVLHAHRVAGARGLAVVGVYHSHPGGAGTPSARDLALAWPGHLCAIVAGGTLRVFARPADGDGFSELAVIVEEGA